MAGTIPVDEMSSSPYVLQFLEDMQQQDAADIGALLFAALQEDSADKPLPFEFVRAVVSQLDRAEARQFLNAAIEIPI